MISLLLYLIRCALWPRIRSISMNFLFFFLAAPLSMRDPSSTTRDQPMPSVVKMWSLNHWSAKEVPILVNLIDFCSDMF